MSDRLTLTYLGHEIAYSENDDLWRCWDYDVEAISLSACKEKVRQVDAEKRRIDRKAFHIDSSCSFVTEVTLSLVDPVRDDVWVIGKIWGREGRHKLGFDNFVLPYDGIEADLAALKAARLAVDKAEKALERARAKLKPPTRVDLLGLDGAAPRERTRRRRR